jgi:hypothetical protein
MSYALRAVGRRSYTVFVVLMTAMLLCPSVNALKAQTKSVKKTPAEIAQDSAKAAAARAAAAKAAAARRAAARAAQQKAAADSAAAKKAAADKAAADKGAAAKATTTPASLTALTTRPCTTPAGTTAPSRAPANAGADAKRPAATGTPTRPTTRATTRPTTRPPTQATAPTAATSTVGLPKCAEAYQQFGAYVGGATAGLGFGTGPSGGVVWRRKSARFPLALRAEVSASRFAQQPLTALGGIAGDASLLHAGGAIGLEWVGRQNRSLRPYATVSGGVYRFQGSGPSGTNGSIADGVFAATTDVALLAGAGLRFGNKMFLEARFITVGDFQSIPIVIGVHF